EHDRPALHSQIRKRALLVDLEERRPRVLAWMDAHRLRGARALHEQLARGDAEVDRVRALRLHDRVGGFAIERRDLDTARMAREAGDHRLHFERVPDAPSDGEKKRRELARNARRGRHGLLHVARSSEGHATRSRMQSRAFAARGAWPMPGPWPARA